MPTPTAQDYFNATRTFLEDMATLEETPGPGTGGRRQILNSSAALRRIFVENLLGRANSKAGLKFTFEARKCHEPKTVMPPDHVLKVAKMTYDEYIGSITYFQAEALDPAEPDNPYWPAQTLTLSRDSWLAHRVGRVLGEPITVRETIKYVANIGGGVHAPIARSKQDEFLLALDHIDEHAATNSPLRQLIYIARVSARGLAPLRDYITSSRNG